jgi:hypothetical protein
MRIKTLLLICTILAEATEAWSQGTLTWRFDSTEFIVRPTDQILITGTVTNSSDAPDLISADGSAFWTGELWPHYDFTWLVAIAGDIVPAHGALQFDFGTLIPIGGNVQPGIYQSGSGAIGFDAIDFQYQYSDNTFVVTVVPEPSTMALLAAGGGMIGFLLKRRSLI